ncbi:MAG: rod shape-determining protein MreD [Actinobacteria bacterium]|nr:rod shape-determining protein MreD [Actinomycetota bacterium]MCZ6519401.1 rod shape-determining protein MreD [Actinomycetota bacterium]MCZ6567081.1 rod shape-determining protein MreD [Actinomycetota bacterium]MCZ6736715.1 rod shape-determining protein MreD [Actinomycetota bacterium]
MVATILLFAVVTQTTLFGRIRFIAPDLVMLFVILLALTRIRPELILGTAFLSGLLVDLLGSSLLGLRAIVFTTVAYVALRTRERAEIGRFAVALWAGILTLIGVVLLVLIGTLFGQTSLLGANVASRLLVVPLANLLLAGLAGPLFVRLVDGDTTAFRFS